MTFIVGFYTRFSIQCGENWASVPPKRECAARVPSAGDTSTNWLSKMSFWRLWQSFCSVVEKAALSSSFFLLPIHLLYVEIFVSNSHEMTVDENHPKCLIFWFWTNYWIDRPFLRQMYSFKVTLYLIHFWLTAYETNLTAAAIVLSIIWQFYQIRYTDSRVSILDVHERKAT